MQRARAYSSRPSWSLTTRSILAAMRSLCVATSAALPSPLTRLRNSAKTMSAVCSSRFPVGSSASTNGGLFARELGGAMIETFAQPQCPEQLLGPGARRGCFGAEHELRQDRILDGVKLGQ